MFNIWAPDYNVATRVGWEAAYDGNLNTSVSPSKTYNLTLGYVKVTRYPIDPNISSTTSGLVQAGNGAGAVISPPMSGTGALAPSAWKAQDISAGSSGMTSLLWLKSDNSFQIWNINDAGVNAQDSPVFAPITGSSGNWTPKRVGIGGDGLTRILMVRTDGAITIWTLNSILGYGSSSDVYGPITGWSCQDMSVLFNNSVQLLWTMSDGHFSTWNCPVGGSPSSSSTFGPYSDAGGSWSARKIGISGGDGLLRILVNRTDGCSVVWKLNPDMTFSSQGGGYGPFVQDSPFTWSAAALALNTSSNSDNKRNLMWVRNDNRAQFWRLSNDDTLPIPQSLEVDAGYGPFPYGSYANCTPQAMSVGSDGLMRVLWTRGDGSAAFWKLAPDGRSILVNVSFAPLP